MTDQDENTLHLVSSYYGPGARILWYLSFSAIVVSWISKAITQDGTQVPSLSTDTIAYLLYPAIAGGDLLIQAINYPYDRYRFIEMAYQYCTTEDIQLIQKMTPDIDELQRFLAMYHSLHLCMSVSLFYIMLLEVYTITTWNSTRAWRSTTAALYLTVTAWNLIVITYVLLRGQNARLLLIIILWPVGQFVPLLFIFYTAFYLFITLLLLCFTAVPLLIGFLFLPKMRSFKDKMSAIREFSLSRSLPDSLLFLALPAVFALWAWACVVFIPKVIPMWLKAMQGVGSYPYRAIFLPDSGTSLLDLDQATAVVAGCCNLSYSIYSACKSLRTSRENLANINETHGLRRAETM